jgi:hypothetical protein
MWGMIIAQQMLMVMALFNVQMPVVVEAFFAQIKKMSTLDFISLDSSINSVLRLNQTEALNDNFDQVGFKSMYFLNNMGVLMIPILAYIIGLILLNITDRISCQTRATAM